MHALRTLAFSIVMLFVAALLLGACDTDDDNGTATPGGGVAGEGVTPADAEEVEDVPPEVAQAEDEWPLPNKDYDNSRQAQDSEINSENVDQLEIDWTFPVPGQSAYGAAATNPVVLDGTVYFQDLASNVFAIDLEDGEVIWEQMYDEMVVGPNGPAVGWDKVFVASGVDTFVALDRETGEELWERELDAPVGAMQPSVYGGMVYVGTQAGAVIEDAGEEELAVRGYEGGATGIIYALDQATGEVEWEFQVVEEGFWGNPDVNSGGGVWYPPAVDTDTGLTFWGTGNPAPFPGTEEYPNAESRPGDNLYTNSVLAMNHETGELVWYNQILPGDLFDHDVQVPKILASITGDDGGQAETPDDAQTPDTGVSTGRDVVIGGGKLGVVFALDRETGETIWEVEVGEHQNNDLEELPFDEEVLVLPGVLGGVETPMAFADGVIYVPVVNLASPFEATGFGAEDGTEALQNIEGRTDLSEGTGELVALSVEDGEVLWETEFDSMVFSGATVVNDLVFVATYEGMIYAFDRETGDEVRTWQAPAGINAWPAVAGDTIVWPAGVGAEAQLLALRLGAEGVDETPDSEGTPTASDGNDGTTDTEETPSGVLPRED